LELTRLSLAPFTFPEQDHSFVFYSLSSGASRRSLTLIFSSFRIQSLPALSASSTLSPSTFSTPTSTHSSRSSSVRSSSPILSSLASYLYLRLCLGVRRGVVSSIPVVLRLDPDHCPLCTSLLASLLGSDRSFLIGVNAIPIYSVHLDLRSYRRNHHGRYSSIQVDVGALLSLSVELFGSFADLILLLTSQLAGLCIRLLGCGLMIHSRGGNGPDAEVSLRAFVCHLSLNPC
jgi:hypothetical protein